MSMGISRTIGPAAPAAPAVPQPAGRGPRLGAAAVIQVGRLQSGAGSQIL